MFKSSTTLIKSIIMMSPIAKKDTISKRIAEHFNLKLIQSSELQKQQPNSSELSEIVLKELDRYNCRSWMLDGFPRTRVEAEQLWKEQKCHVALNLKLPLTLLISQAKKERLIHPASGRIYSLEFNPPQRVNRDDVTDDDLIEYVPFSEEELRDKIMEIENSVKPVLKFYRDYGILQEIHGNSTADLINKSRICLTSLLPEKIL